MRPATRTLRPSSSSPSPRQFPDLTDMTINVALSKAAAGTSNNAKLTSEPQVTSATVERSSYFGEPDPEHIDTFDGGDMIGGETLTSLELDLGRISNHASEGDSECSIPRYPTTRAKKKQKRNTLRQPTSSYSSVQSEDLFDAPFLPPQKHPPLSVSLSPGEKLVPDEGSSPSTILPGNALQLHLDADVSPDTPETSFSFSSSSSLPDRLIIHSPRFDEQPLIPPEITFNDPSTKRPPRVHFRSRVRITSGLHSSRRHTHKHETSMPPAVPARPRLRTSADDLSTSTTTTSGSPSSSISAPLRFQPAENTLLGPLGKRLSSLAQNRRRKRSVSDTPDDWYPPQDSNEPVDERTPFLRGTGPGGSLVPDYSHERRNRGRRSYGGSGGEEDEDISNGLRREENIMFGKWPWRLFNSHWWWYKWESASCCCGNNLDEEG